MTDTVASAVGGGGGAKTEAVILDYPPTGADTTLAWSSNELAELVTDAGIGADAEYLDETTEID
jgi:hypothetical protein